MKKFLAIATLLAITTSSSMAANLMSKVDNTLTKLDQKEQQLNKNISDAQAQRAAKKAEAKKKQEAKKKEIANKKAAIQKRQDDHKKAIENEKSFWKNSLNLK